ncbi:hypothetical protein [Rhodococcus marinonascens]|uniref:hypothetical protein n=1 Tax=Rhodococcus marinonascens TaxID=38311 RepID=UPI000B0288D8|nr:hypothetical protein [Rhodococcus marinonascens]
MQVSVRSRVIAGVAVVAVGGAAAAGVISYTPPPASTTAPEIQLAGIADLLFPGVGQAAVDAATRANETGDPTGAFVGQLPNLLSPALSITSYFLPWDPIALYGAFTAIEQLLNAGLLPDNVTHPDNGTQTVDSEELAAAVSTVKSNLRSVGIDDINNVNPSTVRTIQAVIDGVGVDFNVQSAIDTVRAAQAVLDSQNADSDTTDSDATDSDTTDTRSAGSAGVVHRTPGVVDSGNDAAVQPASDSGATDSAEAATGGGAVTG